MDTLKDVENLLRLREPAAWVALGALVLNIILALVALATVDGSLPSVGWVLSARLANPVPLLVLTVLVSFCVLRDRTPHARQLTISSLIVGGIAVLLGLTFALLGFGATASVLAVFATIVPQAISVMAIAFLIRLLQLQAVPRRLPAGIGLVPYPSDALPPPPTPEPPDPRLQPIWQPDAAAGAAWRTAGDAAAGAPASGWGTDASAGWQPIPNQPSTPQASGQPNPPFNGIQTNPRTTLPVPEQPPRMPNDPWADQGRRNSQQPALDWWDRPQS